MKTYTVTHKEIDALNGYSQSEIDDTIEATTLDEAINIFMDMLPDSSKAIREYADEFEVSFLVETENIDKDGNTLTWDDITELEYATDKDYDELLDDGTIRVIDHFYDIEVEQ